MNTRPSPRSLLLASLGALLLLGTMSAHGDTAATPKTGARAVAATAASSSTVTITGWATFSGVNVAAGTSPNNNAVPAPAAAAAGAELIGAQLVYRPELADLYLRWQVTKLPSTSAGAVSVVGSPSTLYGLRTEIGTTPIEIRAQSTGAGALYQLWTCETENQCVLKATLKGGFGTTGQEVIVTISLVDLAAAGLALREGDKIAAPVAFTANAPIFSDRLPTSLYADQIYLAKTATVTIPVKSVRVSVGKTTKAAVLNKGYFSVAFPRSYFPGNKATVTTKTCLGTDCVMQKFNAAV